MELRQDLDKGKATFTAVSEFLLTHPVLSFGVRDVAHSRLRHTEVLPAEEESESLTTGAYVCTLYSREHRFYIKRCYIFITHKKLFLGQFIFSLLSCDCLLGMLR